MAGSEICLHFSSLQRSDLLVEKIECQNPNRPAKKIEFWQNLFPGGTGQIVGGTIRKKWNY